MREPRKITYETITGGKGLMCPQCRCRHFKCYRTQAEFDSIVRYKRLLVGLFV